MSQPNKTWGNQPFAGSSTWTNNEAYAWAALRRQGEQPPTPLRWGFGAIAYSPATGAYGWASGREWANLATGDAERRCRMGSGRGRKWSERPSLLDDTLDVRWMRNSFAVLIVGKAGRHGIGCGATQRKALRMARQACRGGTAVLSFWSGSPELDPAQRDQFYGMGGTTGDFLDDSELKKLIIPEPSYEIGTWTRCAVCGRPQCPEHGPARR